VGAVSRLLGHFRRRKTLAVATGVVGLALFLIVLLEISLRIQLAQEARDAETDATLAASASAPKNELDDALPVQTPASALLQSSDQVGAPEGAPWHEISHVSMSGSASERVAVGHRQGAEVASPVGLSAFHSRCLLRRRRRLARVAVSCDGALLPLCHARSAARRAGCHVGITLKREIWK
jgi:hypothetical protein